MNIFKIYKAWSKGPFHINNDGEFEIQVETDELSEYIKNQDLFQKQQFDRILNMDNDVIQILYPSNKLRKLVLEHKMKNLP